MRSDESSIRMSGHYGFRPSSRRSRCWRCSKYLGAHSIYGKRRGTSMVRIESAASECVSCETRSSSRSSMARERNSDSGSLSRKLKNIRSTSLPRLTEMNLAWSHRMRQADCQGRSRYVLSHNHHRRNARSGCWSSPTVHYRKAKFGRATGFRADLSSEIPP